MKEKILIVDDHKNNIRLLEDILQDEGYETYVAYDGEEALKQTFEILPDLILLDIMMPKLDGYSVCENLQNSSETEDIPIIMVTARVESIALKKALEVGAYDYIKKPIDDIEVLARVASALKHRNNLLYLKNKSEKDGLTGVCNHSATKDIIEKELKNEDKSMLSFVMLDIDDFKNINDKYGHIVGDSILKELATVISGVVNTKAHLGRYGGDEFYVIASVNNDTESQQLCDEIRDSVESHEFKIPKGNLSLTISLGYRCVPKKEVCTKCIIAEADKALYQAKNAGKNKVVVFDTVVDTID